MATPRTETCVEGWSGRGRGGERIWRFVIHSCSPNERLSQGAKWSHAPCGSQSPGEARSARRTRPPRSPAEGVRSLPTPYLSHPAESIGEERERERERRGQGIHTEAKRTDEASKAEGSKQGDWGKYMGYKAEPIPKGSTKRTAAWKCSMLPPQRVQDFRFCAALLSRRLSNVGGRSRRIIISPLIKRGWAIEVMQGEYGSSALESAILLRLSSILDTKDASELHVETRDARMTRPSARTSSSMAEASFSMRRCILARCRLRSPYVHTFVDGSGAGWVRRLPRASVRLIFLTLSRGVSPRHATFQQAVAGGMTPVLPSRFGPSTAWNGAKENDLRGGAELLDGPDSLNVLLWVQHEPCQRGKTKTVPGGNAHVRIGFFGVKEIKSFSSSSSSSSSSKSVSPPPQPRSEHAAGPRPPRRGHRLRHRCHRRSCTGWGIAARWAPASPRLFRPLSVSFKRREERTARRNREVPGSSGSFTAPLRTAHSKNVTSCPDRGARNKQHVERA